MRLGIYFFTWTFLILCLVAPGAVSSAQAESAAASTTTDAGDAPPASPQSDSNAPQPIHITADQMDADDKEKVVIFSGGVVARQGETVVNCDVMRVYYRAAPAAADETGGTSSASVPDITSDPQAGAAPAAPEASADAAEKDDGMGLADAQNEIDRIECDGNVKITRGNRVAMSDRAVYLATVVPRVMILTGNPKVWRDKDFLSGKKITYYLDEDRSVVEGGENQRVNAVFYQKNSDIVQPSKNGTGGANPKRPAPAPGE